MYEQIQYGYVNLCLQKSVLSLAHCSHDVWHVTDEKWVWLGLHTHTFLSELSKESCYKTVLTLKPLYNVSFEGST